MAVTDPDIFFAALDTAGTFGISLLCGALPAAMAWQQRYGGGADGKIATLPLVPGGKATLSGNLGCPGRGCDVLRLYTVCSFGRRREKSGFCVPS